MPDTFDALVIATFGRHLLVRDAAGRELKARPFGRSLVIVAGDRVLCRDDARTRETHVLELRPRHTALYRSNLRGASEPVVANLSQLLVVLAPLPEADLFVLDRYLAAATSGGISATLVLNKRELGIGTDLQTQLDVYAAAGYDWLACSARTGEGLEAVRAACAGATTALVGQSGVGKSSLIRRLVPAADIQVGELVREVLSQLASRSAQSEPSHPRRCQVFGRLVERSPDKSLFMPILAGPVSNLERYHSEGELAMARGASAAKASSTVTSGGSAAISILASNAARRA